MNDKATVSKVIVILGAVVIIGTLGLVGLIYDAAPPEALVPLVGITTAALGGLTGILASTSSVDVDALKKMADREVE